MTDFMKLIFIVIALILISLTISNFIFDYFDKRKLERRTQQSLKRSEVRQSMNCNNCERLFYYQNVIAECEQEKVHLEKTIQNLHNENFILKDSLSKARLHNQSVSEVEKNNESD